MNYVALPLLAVVAGAAVWYARMRARAVPA
jgi:hypothetical protein